MTYGIAEAKAPVVLRSSDALDLWDPVNSGEFSDVELPKRSEVVDFYCRMCMLKSGQVNQKLRRRIEGISE